MFTNEGVLDRVLRSLLGFTLIVLGSAGMMEGIPGVVLAVAGLYFLATAVVGWSPIYALIRWDSYCCDRLPSDTRGGAAGRGVPD